MSRFTAVATVLTTLALTPLVAQAGTKTFERVKIEGYSGSASWEYTQGNVLTFVSVVVTQNDLSGTAGPSQDAFVSIAINQSDIDTGNVLLTGVAEVSGPGNFEFNVSNDLGSATLRINDAIFQDFNSFSFFELDVDLTWTATSEAFTGKSKENFKEPGLHVMSVFHGTFRDGVAAGSMFGKNIQFTPVPSTTAQVQFNKFGSHTITAVTP